MLFKYYSFPLKSHLCNKKMNDNFVSLFGSHGILKSVSWLKALLDFAIEYQHLLTIKDQ